MKGISKFDNDIFLNDSGKELCVVSKQKYDKTKAIEIAKKEIGYHAKPYYIACKNSFVRHRAGVDEDGEKAVCWWLEHKEHRTSCPVWEFYAVTDAGFIDSEYETIEVN